MVFVTQTNFGQGLHKGMYARRGTHWGPYWKLSIRGTSKLCSKKESIQSLTQWKANIRLIFFMFDQYHILQITFKM